jgi:hypothetical protein
MGMPCYPLVFGNRHSLFTRFNSCSASQGYRDRFIALFGAKRQKMRRFRVLFPVNREFDLPDTASGDCVLHQGVRASEGGRRFPGIL